MNLRSLITFLAALMLSSGCVIVSGGDGGGSGGHGNGGGSGGGSGGGNVTFANVTFNWSFAGESCGQHPEIATVAVTIPGETLMDVGHGAGVYDCTTGGFDGIELHDFATGTYNFTLSANDANNTPIYNGTSTFTIDGVDISVHADLVQVADTSSSALLTWTFPPISGGASSPSCAQVGITNVTYYFDNETTGTTVACTDGNGGTGSATAHYPAGNHAFTAVATDSTGTVIYSYSTPANSPLQVVAGNRLNVAVPFGWAIGGAVVKWTIEDANGTSMLSCADASITDVYVNFSLDGQTWLYPGAGDKEACETGGVSAAVYAYLPPGQYIVSVQGSNGTMNYTSNMVNPPGVAVVAGVFPDGSVTGNDVASVIIKP